MTNSDTKNFSQNVSSSYHLEDRGKCNKNTCANARNVPKLRFKGYNDEWKHVKIGEIYKERSERGNTDAELLSVTMNDGVKRRIDIEGKDISSEDKSNYKSVYIGDMVYNSMRMWQGANGISNYDGIVSPAYTVMFPKTKLCNNFIGYLFKYEPLIFLFRRYSQGLTSDTWNLKYPQIKQLSISIPSLLEQEKIASFLTLIDKKIEKQKELVELLKKYKRGLLSAIFSQKLRFKDDNGNNYPAWEEKRLENILKIKHGKSQKEIECNNGKYPILATGGEIGKTNSYLWDKPCVLIGRKGTIDKPQYMDTPFWTVDTLFYSEVFKENNAKYLYYLFNTINWKKYDESTGVPSLSAKTIERIKVTLSINYSEQLAISKILSKFDDKIQQEEFILEKLQNYKKGLLQQMFI